MGANGEVQRGEVKLKQITSKVELHQRRRKMVATATTGDEEDDPDLALHYTNQEIA